MFKKKSVKKEPLIPDEYAVKVVTLDIKGAIQPGVSYTVRQYTEDLGDGDTLEMVAIPGGMFRMGSPTGQGFDDERPLHNVSVAPFLMGQYPVTQKQWRAVMDWDPPYRCTGDKHPVDRVSWKSAMDFCARLSKRTGRNYRLPSEAEWEYACRAGTHTPFYFGETLTTDVANYVGEHTYSQEQKGLYRHVTTEVGSFPPNAYGLYDMHGNVWEWCADTWHDDYSGAPGDGRVWQARNKDSRVLRGGCWHDPPGLCRCAARLKSGMSDGEDYFGFRVALDMEEL